MSTFDASQNQFNQYHFTVVEMDLPIVTGAASLTTAIELAEPQWYWKLNEETGIVATDTMLNGNLEYESAASSAGYNILPSSADGAGSAKNIKGDTAWQIYDPVPPSPATIFEINAYTGDDSTPRSFTGLGDLATFDTMIWSRQVDGSGQMESSDSISRPTTWSIDGGGTIVSNNNAVLSYDSDGYTIGNDAEWNALSGEFVNWIFVETPNFLSISTYSGNSTSGRTVPHGLTTKPGLVIVKNITIAGGSMLQFNTMAGTQYLTTGFNNAAATHSGIWNDTAMDSTNVTLGNHPNVNTTGNDYMVYAFEQSGSNVVCGEYTGNGGANGVAQDLGWIPDLVIIKATDQQSGWALIDSERGDAVHLLMDLTTTPVGLGQVAEFITDGFRAKTNNIATNSSGINYVYIAIRKAV